MPSHNGGITAAKLYDQYRDGERPKDLNFLDKLVRTTVKVAIELEAPIDIDPMLIATK